MTLTLLLAELYRRTNQPATPAATVTTRYTAYLNEALQEMVSTPGVSAWLTANNPPVPFYSVASQPTYGLPAGISRIDAITERTNDRRLEMRPLDWWRAVEPDPTANTGTPEVWVPLGFQAVWQQPAAATGLWIVSGSASDTTQSVKVETARTAVTGGGVLGSTTAATLNGLTRVQVGTATDHVQVLKFYVSATCVGDISICDAATLGNQLAVIPIGQTYSRYQAIALWPTPSAAITYYVDSEREQTELVNATDEPPMPPRFHRVLIDGALWREYEKTDDDRKAVAERRFHAGVAQWKYFATCPPDYLPVAGDRTMGGRSRFGANFPITRY